MSVKKRLKNALGPKGIVRIRAWRKGFSLPRWGNLRRTAPFSADFGFDRGQAIDRFYIERFFARNAAAITGDVLEVQGPGYTRRYGVNVRTASSIDIDPAYNPTYLVDFTEADEHIPAESFDCLVLPQTWQHFEKLEEGIRQCYRLLRPGGTILATNACMTPMMRPDSYGEHWRFTPSGWRLLVTRCLPGAEIEVQGHGNCLAVVAAAYGLACEELSHAELAFEDGRFPVNVSIRVQKPTS
jgi:SAM-dependent methyltransferase